MTPIAWVLADLLAVSVIVAGLFAVLWLETVYRLRQVRRKPPCNCSSS